MGDSPTNAAGGGCNPALVAVAALVAWLVKLRA